MEALRRLQISGYSSCSLCDTVRAVAFVHAHMCRSTLAAFRVQIGIWPTVLVIPFPNCRSEITQSSILYLVAQRRRCELGAFMYAGTISALHRPSGQQSPAA